MLEVSRHLAPLPLAFALLTGCADPESIDLGEGSEPATHTVRFVGNAYDGVDGTRLTGFALTVAVADVITEAEVADTGRFTVGPIGAWEDYSATIAASGYRPFVSHNAYVGLPAALNGSNDIAEISTAQTLHFDAYLFPADLETAAVTVAIETATGPASGGNIRFRPASPSSLADDPFIETPTAVDGQLWSNDEDLLASTVSADFSGGSFQIAAGSLVYGVTYQVDIYNVAGFQPFTGTFVAGVEGNKTFTLVEELAEPLEVVTSTASSCSPPASPTASTAAVVTIQLNDTIEEGDSGYPGGAAEALDDGLVIVSPDADMVMANILADDDSNTVQERGVSIDFNGDTITISWDADTGLIEKDPDDDITSVTYGNLAEVLVQRVGSPGSAQTLAALLSQTTIVCN